MSPDTRRSYNPSPRATRRARVRRSVLASMAVALPLLCRASFAQAPAPAQLLADADRARGGLATGITWNVTVATVEEGERRTRSFLVKARGNDALVESIAPPRHRGEIMLFNDRTIWFVKPGLRKPVSISARQRLIGDAANGDIASTNYARDYEGTHAGEENVDGAPAWKLDLRARGTNVTYDRIRYWVSKKQHLGLKAEFLTVSGDVFKTAAFTYGNELKTASGRFDFVSRMTIRDQTGAGTVTVIDFGPPKADTHPLSLFNINNVVR